ncbi:putative, inorganic pyrophosphatase (plasmid) [Sodalis praecaptivus]|uniref:inorganic diphosphatase n=1 Tax=Sodalis praecaptivus TaxID=1239307 RepID=W0I3E3_9GAMM|nr:DHHA2 domain-containing protein [Sodalis praecaptivus]AHF79277.1 putative, inorganic pyrophosphatase [Sodalis praecaptivus]
MIHVFGHTHPDSDAICTALVTSYWLTSQQRPASAWRLGSANPETRFIFEFAGMDLPPQLTIPLNGKQVWLVDFSEPAQGPVDLLQSDITGIIDHHRLGGIVTQMPPEVWIKPVGSSATQLWLIMEDDSRRTLPPAHAVLLLGALLSDTVNLRSPTTTQADIRSATELSVLSGVNRKVFAYRLLSAKTDITGLSAEELLNRDLKAFVIAGTDVRIAQLEVHSPDQVSPLMKELHQAMTCLAEQSGAGLVVLMITDISHNFLTLYFAGRESANAASCSVPGMLSRKKQLLPWLESQLHLSRSHL